MMDASAFDQVAESFAAFHRRFAPLFGRPEAQDRSEQYLRGLLVQDAERRNVENLAEAVGAPHPRALQRLLTEAPWSTPRVRDRLQAFLGERLADADSVLVLDDTGFVKQGTHSVGVARQYSGTLGKVGNCQIGVTLQYATTREVVCLDADLYLPEESWGNDPDRLAAAGVPEDTGYRAKWRLGLTLLGRAKVNGFTGVVLADSAY